MDHLGPAHRPDRHPADRSGRAERREASVNGSRERPSPASWSAAATSLADLRTGRLRGRAEVDPDLVEWDYGDYEGRAPPTSARSGPAGSLPRRLPRRRDGRGDRRAGRPDDRLAPGIGGRRPAVRHGHILRVLAAPLARPAGAVRRGTCCSSTASLSILWLRAQPRRPRPAALERRPARST